MSDIKVSIIVPVYNGEKHLYECLNSLVNQTLKEVEIIVINDGSTDKTQSIIDEFASTYSSIRAFSQENQGVIKTRCRGMELARGEYVGWTDSDDFVESDMFERLYTVAKSDDSDVVSCNYNFFPKEVDNKEKWFKEYKGIVDWKFIERNTQQWNKIVRRELLEEINMKHWIGFCGEGAYALVLMFAKKIATVNECLYNYRVGHVSLSSNMSNTTWYEGNVGRTEKQYEMIKEIGVEEEWGEYYRYRVIYSVIQILIIAAKCGEKDIYKKYNQKLHELCWNNNKYTKLVLNHNHGILKSIVFRYIIPSTYIVARFVTKVAMK